MSNRLLVIAGPTASGKSSLAIKAALRYNGEVVSADSMQIYKGMDIGTAKATQEEQAAVIHHMLDVALPTQPYTAALYAQQARCCIDDILSRGKLPILCGGTGLYIEAVLYEMPMGVPPCEALRNQWKDRDDGSLYSELAELDPVAAQRLHPNDRKRVTRALEVCHVTGKPFSEQGAGFRQQRKAMYDFVQICIDLPREELYARIDGRVAVMMEEGLENEVRALADLPRDLTSLQAIGYKEMLAYIDGEISLQEAQERICMNSRRYAKRQLTWFRRDPQVHWVRNEDEAFAFLTQMGY